MATKVPICPTFFAKPHVASGTHVGVIGCIADTFVALNVVGKDQYRSIH